MKLQILANHLQSVKNSSVENSSARVVPIPEKVRVCFFVFSWFVSFCFVFLFFVLFFSFSLCVCVPVGYGCPLCCLYLLALFFFWESM